MMSIWVYLGLTPLPSFCYVVLHHFYLITQTPFPRSFFGWLSHPRKVTPYCWSIFYSLGAGACEKATKGPFLSSDLPPACKPKLQQVRVYYLVIFLKKTVTWYHFCIMIYAYWYQYLVVSFAGSSFFFGSGYIDFLDGRTGTADPGNCALFWGCNIKYEQSSFIRCLYDDSNIVPPADRLWTFRLAQMTFKTSVLLVWHLIARRIRNLRVIYNLTNGNYF